MGTEGPQGGFLRLRRFLLHLYHEASMAKKIPAALKKNQFKKGGGRKGSPTKKSSGGKKGK